jgi:hypothetical protein
MPYLPFATGAFGSTRGARRSPNWHPSQIGQVRTLAVLNWVPLSGPSLHAIR